MLLLHLVRLKKLKLTKNLSREEFRCPCCDFDTVDYELVLLLQDVRDHFNAPVHINSGCRCESRNRAIGGAPKSQHLLGRAADFVVAGVTCADVYAYLHGKMGKTGGLKNYGGWIHADTRTGYWRG